LTFPRGSSGYPFSQSIKGKSATPHRPHLRRAQALLRRAALLGPGRRRLDLPACGVRATTQSQGPAITLGEGSVVGSSAPHRRRRRLRLVEHQDGPISALLDVRRPALAQGLEARPAVVRQEPHLEALAQLLVDVAHQALSVLSLDRRGARDRFVAEGRAATNAARAVGAAGADPERGVGRTSRVDGAKRSAGWWPAPCPCAWWKESGLRTRGPQLGTIVTHLRAASVCGRGQVVLRSALGARRSVAGRGIAFA
jgi:hypothetical protein